MNKLNGTLAIGAALALTAAPVMAAAATPASKLSVAGSIRADSKVRKNAADLRGGSTVVAVGVAALVGLVVVLLAGGSSSP